MSRQPAVLHRDIKPHNIKLTDAQRVMLLDFGLARGNPALQQGLTTGSEVFGYTPQYAPLEQIRGERTDPRSDLYSLGATLYHLLVGVPAEDALTRSAAFALRQPDPLRAPHLVRSQIPEAVSAIIMRASARSMRAAKSAGQNIR